MERKQLLALFLCSLVTWTLGNGLIPLLPVYAARLGASPAETGSYLSFVYFSLALGTFAAGWLADWLQRRKLLLLLSGLLPFPLLWWMGAAATVQQLTLITGAVWFLGGISITLINILAGLFAGTAERGRVFGTLAFAGGLGALAGGLATGPIVDHRGFGTLFIVAALFSLAGPAMALFIEDKQVSPSDQAAPNQQTAAGKVSAAMYLLLIASVLAGIAIFTGRLGTSLQMEKLLFSSAAISSTGAVAGLISLPLSPYIGTLSDRLGRKQLLVTCYIIGAAGIGLLSYSTALWQYWAAASLIAVLAFVSPGVGSALVTDLVSPKGLGRAMAYFNATTWVGGIVGFAGAGVAFEQFGLAPSLLLAGLLPVGGALLLATLPTNPQGAR